MSVAMQGAYTTRWATQADYDQLADVMFDAVRCGPSRYTEEQRAQWVPERRGGRAWEARLDQQEISAAERNGEVVGFMSLTETGYIDFAYIRPSAQGTGLFRQLLLSIERRSVDRGDSKMWVHASLMAEPAFSAVGFTIIERQNVSIGDETFERFEMEKPHATTAIEAEPLQP